MKKLTIPLLILMPTLLLASAQAQNAPLAAILEPGALVERLYEEYSRMALKIL